MICLAFYFVSHTRNEEREKKGNEGQETGRARKRREKEKGEKRAEKKIQNTLPQRSFTNPHSFRRLLSLSEINGISIDSRCLGCEDRNPGKCGAGATRKYSLGVHSCLSVPGLLQQVRVGVMRPRRTEDWRLADMCGCGWGLGEHLVTLGHPDRYAESPSQLPFAHSNNAQTAQLGSEPPPAPARSPVPAVSLR